MNGQKVVSFANAIIAVTYIWITLNVLLVDARAVAATMIKRKVL